MLKNAVSSIAAQISRLGILCVIAGVLFSCNRAETVEPFTYEISGVQDIALGPQDTVSIRINVLRLTGTPDSVRLFMDNLSGDFFHSEPELFTYRMPDFVVDLRFHVPFPDSDYEPFTWTATIVGVDKSGQRTRIPFKMRLRRPDCVTRFKNGLWTCNRYDLPGIKVVHQSEVKADPETRQLIISNFANIGKSAILRCDVDCRTQLLHIANQEVGDTLNVEGEGSIGDNAINLYLRQKKKNGSYERLDYFYTR